MNLESYGTISENLLMAKTDLAVLRDLFHTLNDAGISLSSLNCSIALLEEFIDKSEIEAVVTPSFKNRKVRNTSERSYQMWRKSNTIFAHQSI